MLSAGLLGYPSHEGQLSSDRSRLDSLLSSETGTDFLRWIGLFGQGIRLFRQYLRSQIESPRKSTGSVVRWCGRMSSGCVDRNRHVQIPLFSCSRQSELRPKMLFNTRDSLIKLYSSAEHPAEISRPFQLTISSTPSSP